MKLKIRAIPKKSYAFGAGATGKSGRAIQAETQRNILAMNANEKIAERDAATTLEQERIKAEQTGKIIIAVVLILFTFLIVKFL